MSKGTPDCCHRKVSTQDSFYPNRHLRWQPEEYEMEILHTHCAGLDVHKKVVVATILVSDEHGQLTKETRSFETTTTSLLALSD
jgi:hypothetical protein